METQKIESFAVIFHSLTRSNEQENPVSVTVTSHPVSTHDDKITIGAGQNISMKEQSKMAALLIDSLDTELKIFPDTVLARSFDALVWYRPAARTEIRFIQGGDVISFSVPTPNLIFKLKQGKLSVVSVEGNKKPVSSSKLYHAPFGNINEASSMCVGNNSLPDYPSLTVIEYIERFFFESEFTEHRNEFCIKDVTDWVEHVSFWKGLKDKQTFPKRKMSYIRSKSDNILTLQDWIEDDE